MPASVNVVHSGAIDYDPDHLELFLNFFVPIYQAAWLDCPELVAPPYPDHPHLPRLIVMTTQPNSKLDAQALVRPLLIKDLRVEARARGISPAGGAEELRGRIVESMLGSNHLALVAASTQAQPGGPGGNVNNYTRPGGQQNVGNFITDRNTSRVLAPPGGSGNIVFGDQSATADALPAAAPKPSLEQEPPQMPASRAPEPPATQGSQAQAVPPSASQQPAPVVGQLAVGSNNNYARPGGQQNVGNFITDRASSRVLAPPGGGSQLSLG